MSRKNLFLIVSGVLIIVLAFRIGYLYVELGKWATENDDKSPSIFYGRPLEIRKGDHLGNIRFIERLNKLSYKKVWGKPSTAGTFSQDAKHILIFLRNKGIEKRLNMDSPVDIAVRDGRVTALSSSTGKKLESIRLEPAEIGRLNNTEPESRYSLTLATISPYLQNAVIASEDPRFYYHFGFDIPVIGCGSTITQQLAKDLFLSPRKVFARKLRALELALAMELRYSKKQILEMYLNKIYLGHAGSRAIYGVEEAANFYFSKNAKKLSLEEAALLAGIIDSPNRHNPFRNLDAAKELRNKIMTKMRRKSMIREDEFLRASKAPVRLQSSKAPVNSSSYFIDYIQRITREGLGTEKFYHPGYCYYTSLDPIWQAIAQEAVAQGLTEIEQKAFPAGEPLQAALIAVDPKTGEMVAMVGGRNYGQTKFNRAVDAKRQPGSAFKPFVLLAALSQSLENLGNWTLSTMVSGETISLPTPEGLWTPSNFEDKKYGKITIRKAIEDSVNTATTRLANDVGFEEVLKTARLTGIMSPLLPVPSMALGSFEVTPMELAYAYTTIASGGIRFERFPLFSVTAANGDKIVTKKVKREQVLDARVTYLAGYAMEGVLQRGTAKESRLLNINFPASGKTGTTNGNKDSWFVGYTKDMVCAVWVGYDSGADTGLTGADGALHIWTRFMRAVYSQSGPLAVVPPKGIETAVIDLKSGYLATKLCPQTFTEAYLTGTIPNKTCPDHPMNPVADKIRKKVQEAGKALNKLFK
ncbi:multimodular transpeptidase-transglycosylase [hydrocarbon metagenome]|uniref:peptidoglycan glycosyltransferase n=1 Tax=hydrocarbon metagenome TaxID=938273 RepID=A0A0W8FMK1_9ZZZZ